MLRYAPDIAAQFGLSDTHRAALEAEDKTLEETSAEELAVDEAA